MLRIVCGFLLLSVAAFPGDGRASGSLALWSLPAGHDETPGLQILGSLGGGRMLVRAPASAVAGLDARAFEAADKMAPALYNKARRAEDLALVLAPGTDADHFRASLSRRFPELQWRRLLTGPPARWIVENPLDGTLLALAADPRLVWIEPHVPYRVMNIDSVGPLQANAPSGGDPPTATPIWDNGLIGSGQIIAIADSGVDRNEGWFTQLDRGLGVVSALTNAQDTQPPQPGVVYPERKIYGYWVMPGASAYDDNEVCRLTGNGFHGTHVAGTAAGDSGTASTPAAANYDRGDGMAPQAQILVQDLGNDTTGCLDGDGGAAMWAQARAAGAAIHSNSYGGPASGGYTSGDAELDDFLWRNPDMLIVFAAGNGGGQPGEGTIFHPANAKHTLSVGALNHGDSLTPWINSSRGPASDGRIKPDVMAPGAGIRSARGDDNDSGFEGAELGSFSGTSMAAPAVAGAAALARQYFADGFYPDGAANPGDGFLPAGDLLKAVLINGTQSYNDTPAFDTGWGRVWLDGNLYFGGDARQLRVWSVPHSAGLGQGEQRVLNIQAPAGAELRATLVWYDPAPALASNSALVNDLDLTLTGPDGAFLGNVYSGGASATGGAADRLNPVEQVLLPAPMGGSYQLTIDAPAVPGNGELASRRQGYALVVSHGQCDTAVTDAPVLQLSADGGGVNASWQPLAGAQGYQLYRADGDCPAGSEPIAMQVVADATGSTLVDTSTQGAFSYAYTLRGVDGCGEGPASACVAITSQAPCTLQPLLETSPAQVSSFGDFCGAALSWATGQAQCPGASLTYELHRNTDPFFEPDAGTLVAAGLAQPEAQDYSAPAGVTHYYRAVAVDSAGNRSLATAPAAYAAVSSQRQPATFFDGAEALALAGLTPPWRLTAAAAASGSHAYRSGPDGLTYPPDTCAALVTPPMDLAAGAQLSYQARWDLEATFDGVVVEVSANGGLSWTDLPPSAGYPGDFSATSENPFNACALEASRGAFNGSSGDAFVAQSSDLAGWAGQTVQLRWRLSSDPAVELAGFFLDDIQVTNASMPLACQAGELLLKSGFE